MSKTLLDYFSGVFEYVVDIQKRAFEGDHAPYSEVYSEVLLRLDKAAEENEVEEGMVGEIKRKNYSDEYIDLAKFATVSFIDEILVSSDWMGKSDWVKNLLQKQIYSSAMAGAQFFEKMDKLKDVVNKEERDTLEVFFTALVLGFEGVFFENQDQLKEMIRNTHSKIQRYDEIYQVSMQSSIPEGTATAGVSQGFTINRTTFFMLYGVLLFGSWVVGFWWYADDLSTAVNFLLQIYNQ